MRGIGGVYGLYKIWNYTETGLSFPGGSDLTVWTHLQCGRPGFETWVGKISWTRAWQLTPVFLPGECSWTKEPVRLHSPWGLEESNMTEQLNPAHSTTTYQSWQKYNLKTEKIWNTMSKWCQLKATTCNCWWFEQCDLHLDEDWKYLTCGSLLALHYLYNV